MHRVFTFSFFSFYRISFSRSSDATTMCMNPTYAPIPAYAYPIWPPHSTSSWLIWYFTWTLPPWLHVCSVLNLVCHRYWWRHNDVIVKDTLDIPWCRLASVPNPNFVYRFPIYCTTYAINHHHPPQNKPATHQPFHPSSRIILHITWHCNLILYIRRTCKKNHFRFSFCVLLQNTPSPPPTLRIWRRRYEPENITKLLVLFKIWS